MTHFDESMSVFDRDYLWHPYTTSRSDIATYPVVSAHQCQLELADGRHLIDGTSSWWSVIHGYNHPRLNHALKTQVDEMAHVMFGGLTHPPAVELGRRLHDLLPPSLQRIFYCDSGSVAVEIAVKMALQYQRARKRPQRTRFTALQYAYHGDTLVAMSLCDPISSMHSSFEGALPEQIFIPAPACGETCDVSAVQALEQCFERNHEQIAGLIIEPVVQGAGGMRIYNSEYLRHARDLCNRYEILLIFDEIATGFGRTGKMFAFEHRSDCIPDILCLGKALTAGYMSFATTIASAEVADAIDAEGVFLHGPTYMANPLACALAVASIDLLKEGNWRDSVCKIESYLQGSLDELKELSSVADVRCKGAIGVIETNYSVPHSFTEAFVNRGVWIRPFRNLVYIMPAYTISEYELEQLCSAMKEVVKDYDNEVKR